MISHCFEGFKHQNSKWSSVRRGVNPQRSKYELWFGSLMFPPIHFTPICYEGSTSEVWERLNSKSNKMPVGAIEKYDHRDWCSSSFLLEGKKEARRSGLTMSVQDFTFMSHLKDVRPAFKPCTNLAISSPEHRTYIVDYSQTDCWPSAATSPSSL